MGEETRQFWRRKGWLRMQWAVAAVRRVRANMGRPEAWGPRLGRAARGVDVRRPVHAAVIGALLAGIVAPVAGWLVTNERYRLSDSARLVAERPAPRLMNKLRYVPEQRAAVFNAEGMAQQQDPKDQLTAKTGGGKKQLYTATLPDDPAQGIEVRDNVNDLTVKFVPETGLLGGRSHDGQMVYPLKDAAGQMIFTPKGNGLKEDIVLAQVPGRDEAEFAYRLSLPDTVTPRLEDDGSVGFYTATPELFGDISYGTDQDRQAIEKARLANAKNYKMFAIPAPVVHETGRGGTVMARFALDGARLVLHVRGLKQGGYPLSIDPTFLLSTTADFVTGSIDDNIDLSQTNQVGRAVLSGGSTPTWTDPGILLANANFAASLVAYNGFLYMIGGGATNTRRVQHIAINLGTGAITGAWTIDSSTALNTGRQGLAGFGFNGYLYAVGGEDTSAVPITSASAHTVEFAKINSDGSVGTWSYTTGQLNAARGYPAGASYQGVLYVMGGSSGTLNASLRNDSEYARINGDGNISSWTTTSSFTTARNRFQGAAYNGFVYITGGRSGTPAVLNDVQYAPITSTGALGTWVTTTSFPTARRDHGMAVNNGYIYVYAGCNQAALACANTNMQADTEYAVINADGTVGQWQQTLTYDTGQPTREPGGSAFYSNHLYFVAGCQAEGAATGNTCTTALSRTFYSSIDSPGRYDRGIQTIQTTAPFNNNAATVSRMGAQATALNGYLYLVGGCTVASCNTAVSYTSTVEYAPFNADGSLGTFNTTATLITTSGGANNAGRVGMAVAAYNNKVYVIGGVERTTGNADSYRTDVISASQNTNGTLNTFTQETNSLPVAKAFATVVVWHNWIYVLGGLSSATTVTSTIYHAQIGTTNVPGTWTATTNGLTNARWGHSGGVWGNWIYAIGGQSNTTGTYITAANGAEQLTIQNSGDINTAASVQNVSGAPLTRLMGGFVHNGVIYTFGGYTNGSTSAVATINWSSLNSSTGALGAWSATNIGNISGSTAGLATARGVTTAVPYGGNFYVLGGCTSTLAATSFSACSSFVSTAQTSEVNLPNNGGTGQTGTWTTTGATVLPTATADHATVAYNGNLYAIGGCTGYTTGACTNGSNVTTVEAAPINTDGTIGSWTTTGMTALPTGRSLVQAVAYNGYMYVIGGRVSSTTTAVGTVTYAPISSTGTVGAWSNADLPTGVNAERVAFGAAIVRGYLYVAGGDNGSGTKKNDVYYAQISTTNGSLGTWNTTTSFTTARSGLSVVGYNDKLYVAGGTDGTNNLTDVQMGTVATDGTIAAWSFVTDVGRGASFRQAVAANGYFYFLGNEGANQDVMYADINANGTLGTIQRSVGTLTAAHAHGSGAYFEGFFYITGGCTLSSNVCTTVSTTSERSGQLAISRVGHYSKLFNTEVDTAPSQLVLDGALSGPGSRVAVRFYTEQASATSFGVAQVFDPVIFGNFYTVQALDSSGNNTGVAFNYLIALVLDDSNSGTFPDVTTSSETNVQDITLYYHANPTRRLRHGASFTNTGCNATPANGCILDTAP